MQSILEIIEDARNGRISDEELIKKLSKFQVDVKDMEYLDMIDEDEERELVDRMKDGDEEASRILQVKHLPIVTSIASEYLSTGRSYLELIEDGIKGLNIAASRYDTRVGYKFAVHCVWWIRQTIVKSSK